MGFLDKLFGDAEFEHEVEIPCWVPGYCHRCGTSTAHYAVSCGYSQYTGKKDYTLVTYCPKGCGIESDNVAIYIEAIRANGIPIRERGYENSYSGPVAERRYEESLPGSLVEQPSGNTRCAYCYMEKTGKGRCLACGAP